jgi:RNA polymerase sigma-70 factor, ECF subfamily
MGSSSIVSVKRLMMKSDGAADFPVIKACQEGDRDAFRVLFESYRDRTYTIAYHFCSDETMASDITQQVFLKLFDSIRQFRFNSEFITWLYRLVANVCIDEHRRRRRFLQWPAPRGGSGEEADVSIFEKPVPHSIEDHIGEREMNREVRRAVASLSPKLRLVILLRYFEDFSYDQMATVLGCSSGTVASRLNRGHQQLAKQLAHLKPEFGRAATQ